MTRNVLAGLLVGAAIAGGFATRTTLGQSQTTRATPEEFQQRVLPVLAKNCMTCHSDKVHAGDFSLER